MKIINIKKKKMKLLTKEQQSYQNAKLCYICIEKIKDKHAKDRKLSYSQGLLSLCRHSAHSICDLKYSVPKKIPIAFHNGSNYDCHFAIKELEKFKKQFTCLGENTEKYITFTVPVEKEFTKIDKNEEEITKMHPTDYNLMIAQDL